jgi:integral membrane protein TIGR01906
MILKALSYIFGITISVAIIMILLLTSVKIVAINDFEFYRNQYVENDVYSNIAVNEKDLMYVTTQLISYMDGKRGDLSIIVNVAGEEKEFFNQREKDHMVDVRNLVAGGKKLRIMLIGIVALLFILMKALKLPVKNTISKSAVFTISAVTIASCILAYIISRNFTDSFIVLHEILFTNTLWVLDYSTDRLLNMVPEIFFINMAIKIGVIFLCMVFIYFIISLIFVLKGRKKTS